MSIWKCKIISSIWRSIGWEIGLGNAFNLEYDTRIWYKDDINEITEMG